MKKYIAVVLGFFIFLCATILTYSFPQSTHAAIDPSLQKGVTIVPHSQTDLSSPSYRHSIDRLAATGANYVTFVLLYKQSHQYSHDIYPNLNLPSDASLRDGIRYAKSKGMQVALKPHVDPDNGWWRALIQPTDKPAWFRAYGDVLRKYAGIAQQEGVHTIVIGTEFVYLTSTQKDPNNTQYWKNIISSLRSMYNGKLTYSAQWGGTDEFEEAKYIGFWPELDYMGFSAYYILSTHPNPTIQELVSNWENNYATRVQPLATKFNKPVVFSEIGYRSIEGASVEPWGGEPYGNIVDLQEQADCYEALFTLWSTKPNILGISLWSWNSNPDQPTATDTTYFPQNKPAEAVMTKWFGGTGYTLPPPSTAPSATIFEDSLAPWQNWSWGGTLIQVTNPVYSGSTALSFTANAGWAGLKLHSDTGINTTQYKTLQFYARADRPNQKYTIVLHGADGKQLRSPIKLTSSPYVQFWTPYSISLTDLNASTATIKDIVIQDDSGTVQGTVYLDLIRLVAHDPAVGSPPRDLAAQVAASNVHLSWIPSLGQYTNINTSDHDHIQVYTNSDFTGIKVLDGGVGAKNTWDLPVNTSGSYGTVRPGTTYYARVYSFNAVCNCSDGTTVSFTTPQVTSSQPTPTPTSATTSQPASNLLAEIQSSKVILTWTPSTGSYMNRDWNDSDHIQVYTNPDYTGTKVLDGGVNGGNNKWEIPINTSGSYNSVKPGVKYYARVYSFNAPCNCSTGTNTSFTVPQTNTQGTPATNLQAEIQTTKVILTWTPSTGMYSNSNWSDSDHIQVYTNANYTGTRVLDGGVNGGNNKWEIPINTSGSYNSVKPGTTYYARVYSFNAPCNCSDGTSISFTVPVTPTTNPTPTPPPSGGSIYSVGQPTYQTDPSKQKIKGSFDGLTRDGKLYGWACDSDNFSRQIDVHIYINGPYGAPGAQGVAAGTANATGEQAIASFCGGTTAHRFYVDLPLNLRDGVTRRYYVHGINVNPGPNSLLPWGNGRDIAFRP